MVPKRLKTPQPEITDVVNPSWIGGTGEKTVDCDPVKGAKHYDLYVRKYGEHNWRLIGTDVNFPLIIKDCPAGSLEVGVQARA